MYQSRPPLRCRFADLKLSVSTEDFDETRRKRGNKATGRRNFTVGRIANPSYDHPALGIFPPASRHDTALFASVCRVLMRGLRPPAATPPPSPGGVVAVRRRVNCFRPFFRVKVVTEKEIAAQIKAIVRKEASLLEAAPDELRDVLKQRIDYLREYGKAAERTVKPVKIGNRKAAPAADFRTFTNTTDADRWTKKLSYEDWSYNLSPAERTAIQDYKSSSYSLKKALRSPVSGILTTADETQMKLLDAALARHPLPEPVTVIRYFNLADVKLTYDDVKVGIDITDNGFVSTSVNPHHSRSGHRFEIRLPAGTYAGYTRIAKETHQGEYELTLAREVGTFRVVELKRDAHKTIVVESLIPKVKKK